MTDHNLETLKDLLDEYVQEQIDILLELQETIERNNLEVV